MKLGIILYFAFVIRIFWINEIEDIGHIVLGLIAIPWILIGIFILNDLVNIGYSWLVYFYKKVTKQIKIKGKKMDTGNTVKEMKKIIIKGIPHKIVVLNNDKVLSVAVDRIQIFKDEKEYKKSAKGDNSVAQETYMLRGE